ncbi:5-formyltetrahydrofolate cyclo-ligase [Proteiniborus ethanoligenes]|uniref:5-formyltetrahydrofolate cyclo-ligase n=1 Tax=Proteiniborus ethanoligenes TaxID=415015 RepID=A0A1H3M321_9FIRM|nr:5-formyltetrahydrofolate cyclo-ligase [Proteiniborus ethanoligenes]SDY71110.1 5-formyltetrahydrofolate cyclo-ligase [Proteiniborus ethanoligenes]
MRNYRKHEIRQEMIALRKQMSKEQVEVLSEKIISTLTKLPIFKESKSIMLYLSFDNEVDTFKLIQLCKDLGKNVIVPFCIDDGKRIVPTEIKSVEKDLVKSSFGYLEPKAELVKPVSTESIDLIILPGLAFDRGCFRVGFGAGYYDRFLSKLCFTIPTIGLAYDYQILEYIATEEHDMPVDYVVTDSRIIIR